MYGKGMRENKPLVQLKPPKIGELVMPACIYQNDRGVVGFVGELGKTWHNLPQYKHVNDAVSKQEAEDAIVFPVEKIPLQTVTGIQLENHVQLVRTDLNVTLGNPVSKDYEVVSNLALIELAEMINATNQDLVIESCGTLHNGATSFVNVIVKSFQVKGDVSLTSSRMLLTNGFGGLLPVASCLHTTRIVCNNTLRMAVAQGSVDGTLRRFKHTKLVHEKLASRTLDLTKLIAANDEHIAQLDSMSNQDITEKFIKEFLEKMFPAEDKSGRGETVATNKKNEVETILLQKPDLVNLPMTKYRLLQAVTDWTSNRNTRKDNDAGSRFISSVSLNGTADKINQQAFAMLSA